MNKRLWYSRIDRVRISIHTAYYRFAPITVGWKYACICSRSWTYLARNLFGVSCFPSFTKATGFSRDSFYRTFQIECVKKCSEFIWRANLQMCFLFSKIWHSDNFFLSDAGQNLITYPVLHLNLSLWLCRCMPYLSLCCFQFGLFHIGTSWQEYQNIPWHCEISPIQRPMHTFVFVLLSAQSGVWTQSQPLLFGVLILWQQNYLWAQSHNTI